MLGTKLFMVVKKNSKKYEMIIREFFYFYRFGFQVTVACRYTIITITHIHLIYVLLNTLSNHNFQNMPNYI